MSDPPGALARWCNRLEHAALPSDYQLLDAAGLHSGHPWAFLADIARAEPGSVAYYRYLYGLVRLLDPTRILEVGTAFGMSAATFLQAAPNLRSLVSLDLGVFTTEYDLVAQDPEAGWSTLDQYKTRELPADGRNIAFAREVLKGVAEKLASPATVSLFQVNTQPQGSDNFDAVIKVPRWTEVAPLVAELERAPFDLLFIDGKHTDDGLYQDFKSFFRYVRPGGLIICDDLHDSSYSYAWAGQTVASYQRILEEYGNEIADSHIWSFPQLPDNAGQEPIARPYGLIRKRGGDAAAHALAAQKRLLLDELGSAGASGETTRLLAFLGRHAPLLAEIERLGLGEEAVQRLALVKDNPLLFAELGRLGLPDEVAARRLGFLGHHLELFAELEVRGLVESTAARLRFLADRASLFEELEALGLGERASAALKIVRTHPRLFQSGDEGLSDLELLGPAQIAPFLSFARYHPHLVAYLRARPALAADIERFQRDNHSAMPNVALMGHLVWRMMPGARRR